MPTPAVYGAVTVVEGTSIYLTGNLGTQTTDPDGSMHSRGGAFSFEEVMNDPRVSGEHLVTDMSMDYWGDPSGAAGALVQWGNELIRNEQGTWVGVADGIYSSDRGDIIVGWLRGTGAYEGLTYYMAVDSLVFRGGVTSVYRVRGQIFPGEPPEQAR